MKNNTFPTLLIGTMSFLMASCASVKEPELKGIESIKMDKLDLSRPSVSMDLVYFNPNKYKIKLKRAEGDAWLNGRPLGHFTVDSLIHIAALSDFQLPVNLQVDKDNLSKNASLLLLGQEVTLKVDAIAKVGKGPVFINYPIHYEGKQNLKELWK